MKRMVSVCLALCLALTLTAPAWADAAPLESAPLTLEAAPPEEAPAAAGDVTLDGAPVELTPAEEPVQDAQSLEENFVEDAKNAGNTMWTATGIGTNRWVSGYTADKYQNDYYKFTLSQPGKVSISFRHARSDSDDHWSISLGRDSNGNYSTYFSYEVALREYADMTTCNIGLPAGTYYARVWPGSENYANHPHAPVGENYSICINYQASNQWETEYNNSMLNSADSIQTGQTYYGSTHDSYDNDYYKFTLPQRTRINLTFNHTRENSDDFWTISLGYDNNGSYSQIVSDTSTLSDASSATLTAILNAGTYYMRIWPGNANYTNHPDAPTGRDYSFTLTDATSQITAFVTRLYEKCLGRQPDAGGLNTWVTVLSNGSWTAERVAWGFVFSKEYTNRRVSNDEYVKMLYRVYMDREADTSGYNTWMNALNSGWSREQVMEGFSRSVEFRNICNRYGMMPW